MNRLKLFGYVCASLFLGGALFLIWFIAKERTLAATETEILQLLDGYCYRQARKTLLNQDSTFIKTHSPLAAAVFRLNNDLDSANQALSLSHSDRLQKEWDLQQVLVRLEGPKWKDQLDYALFLSQQNPALNDQIMEAIVRGCMARLEPLVAGQWIDRWKRESISIRCQMAEATFHEFTDHREEALEILERLSQTLNNCSPEIEARAGSLLLALNKPDLAIKYWDKALFKLPDQPDWVLQKAKTLDLLGKTDLALALLDQILTIHAEAIPEAFAERGKLLLQGAKPELALADLEKALALEPGNVIAAENYRKALYETGNEIRAAEWKTKVEKMRSEQERLNTIFQKELPLRPQDANLMAEAAGIFLRSGHPKSALVWAKKALTVDPGNIAANSLLAGYYEAIGNPGLAAEHKRLISRSGANK